MLPQAQYFPSPMQQQQLHPSLYGVTSRGTSQWIGASAPSLDASSSTSSSAAAHYHHPVASMASFGSQSSADDMIQSPVLSSHSGFPSSGSTSVSSSCFSPFLAASDSFALNEERLPSSVAPALYFASLSSSCGVSTSTNVAACNTSNGDSCSTLQSTSAAATKPHHPNAATTAATSNRFKRPREEFAADSQFFHSDNTLHAEVSDSQPPLKRQHGEDSSSSFPTSVSLPTQLSNSDIVSDNDDDVMTSPQGMSGSCSPSPVCVSDTESNASPVDGEIDTDQWNLSKLRLEVNNEFQPLLNHINSHNAKNAAGFESDPNSTNSILREFHRELEQKRNNHPIIRAVWDKNSTYNCVTADGTIKHFAPSSEAPQQSLVLYHPRQRTPTLRSVPAPSTNDTQIDFDLSHGFSGANNIPIQFVRSSPIITEEADDNDTHYSHHTSTSTSSSSSTSFDSSSSYNDMSDVRVGLSPIPSSSSSSTASVSASTSATSVSASASAHVPAKRLEKRRRDSDADMNISSSLRIEEIHDDEVQAAKKQRLRAATAAATAGIVASTDSSSSRRTSIVSDSDMASGDDSGVAQHHVAVSSSPPSSVESPQSQTHSQSLSFTEPRSVDFVHPPAHDSKHQQTAGLDEEKESPFIHHSSHSRPLEQMNGWMTAERRHQQQQQQQHPQQQHTVHHMIW